MKDYYIAEEEWFFSVFSETRVRGNGFKLWQAGSTLEIKNFLTLENMRHFISVLGKPQKGF